MGNQPVKPNSEDFHSHHHAMLHDLVMCGKGLVIGTEGQLLVEWNGQSYVIKLARLPSGVKDGDTWPPKNYPATLVELDTKTFAVGDWLWVRSTDEVVTVGMTDPDSGATVYSTPGLYRARQAVVPVSNGSGGFKHHIPLVTMPNPADIEDVLNYWVFISPAFSC